ncbi:MAG: hypothetical protein JWL71_3684 [Acidobacteria bacterium]|nr:hypothetical protein [Acidobacteriota bacterium]
MAESTARPDQQFGPYTADTEPMPDPPRKRVSDWVTLALAVIALVSVAMNTFGLRLWGAPQDMQLLTTRVVKLETTQADVMQRLQTVEESVRMSSYILCVSARRNDPASAPPGCTPVLSRGAP